MSLYIHPLSHDGSYPRYGLPAYMCELEIGPARPRKGLVSGVKYPCGRCPARCRRPDRGCVQSSFEPLGRSLSIRITIFCLVRMEEYPVSRGFHGGRGRRMELSRSRTDSRSHTTPDLKTGDKHLPWYTGPLGSLKTSVGAKTGYVFVGRS